VLGLPAAVIACLFDLDGVLTDTAAVHDKAWAEMVDAFLRERAERTGESFVAFDPVADYGRYVDGKPRADGVRDEAARDAGLHRVVVSSSANTREVLGGFGFVVGVDRVGHADALRAHGADIVVEDLAELLGDTEREAAR